MPIPGTTPPRHPLETGCIPGLRRSWPCVGASRPGAWAARRAPPGGRQRRNLDRAADRARARELPESCASAGGTFPGGLLAGMGRPLRQLDNPRRRQDGQRQDRRSGRAGGRRDVPLSGWISRPDRDRCRVERAKGHDPVRLDRNCSLRRLRQRASLRAACRGQARKSAGASERASPASSRKPGRQSKGGGQGPPKAGPAPRLATSRFGLSASWLP